MSQKVSPILFNNYIYNNSKWFNKKNNKFILNEDLQIRELINIIFKNNINSQFLFIDKIVTYKYATKIKIYIYYFCNFAYLKKNIIIAKNYKNALIAVLASALAIIIIIIAVFMIILKRKTSYAYDAATGKYIKMK